MKNINKNISQNDVQLELIQKEILSKNDVNINLISKFIIKRFMEQVV